MPYQKYRPNKQWGKINTRIFKTLYARKITERMPAFSIPEAVRNLGVQIFDPNDQIFPSIETRDTVIDYSTPNKTMFKDNPHLTTVHCELFNGQTPFTDGIDQACALTKAVKRIGFPSSILQKALETIKRNNLNERLSEYIMRGERYDPSLIKLPRKFDPVIFWITHPLLCGTPMWKKSNIILENLFREVLLSAQHVGQLADLRFDFDEEIRCSLTVENWPNPLVIRTKPHIIVQSPVPITCWANEHDIETTRYEEIPSIAPIDPRIDLSKEHIYDDTAFLPRISFPLHLDTIMWAREQDQRHPWTREENAANAIMFCFGAAVAEAISRNVVASNELKKPIVTRAVQLVHGKMDLIAFQLNTLDFDHAKTDSIKNIVWIEHAQQLYEPGDCDKNYDAVIGLNEETFQKMAGLLLQR